MASPIPYSCLENPMDRGALGLHGDAWSGPRGCRVGQDLATEHARAELHDPGRAESRNAELEMWRNHGYEGLTISFLHGFFTARRVSTAKPQLSKS